MGSQTGEFGPIISPLFGTYGTHPPDCDGNTLRWFERNLVWGLDHPVVDYEPQAEISGAPWSQSAYNSLSQARRDDCDVVGGLAVEVDGFPINSVKVDTGFPNPEMTNGLVSNQTFDGRPSRLQQGTANERTAWNKNQSWDLDNVGPWSYLTDDISSGTECRASSYTGTLTTEEKVALFEGCLNSSPQGVIFDEGITNSPRFVWAPEYGLVDPPGSKFTPIRRFHAVFIGGVWFNCPNPNSGNPCGVTFYPDADDAADLCDGTYPSCKQLNVDQVSAWLIPGSALPQSVLDAFEQRYDDLEPSLYQ